MTDLNLNNNIKYKYNSIIQIVKLLKKIHKSKSKPKLQYKKAQNWIPEPNQNYFNLVRLILGYFDSVFGFTKCKFENFVFQNFSLVWIQMHVSNPSNMTSLMPANSQNTTWLQSRALDSWWPHLFSCYRRNCLNILLHRLPTSILPISCNPFCISPLSLWSTWSSTLPFCLKINK